jgi:hypothetical protein
MIMSSPAPLALFSATGVVLALILATVTSFSPNSPSIGCTGTAFFLAGTPIGFGR